MSHRHDDELDDHDKGLAFDMPKLISRRRVLGLLGGTVTSAALAACGASSSSGGSASTATATATTDSTTTTPTATTDASDTSEIPDETAGPFPGDGSNGPNVLTESGAVRKDISRSFGDASGVAEGVATTVEMTLLDVAAGGTPLAGAAVYLWHCTNDGRYTLYDDSLGSENFLRGVQESDSDGKLTFTTIFPGAYAGRWPHMHFEVYKSFDAATAAGTKLKTSQIALPEETCKLVYATSGYEPSVQNLAQISLDSDMVFGDGYASELATASGTVDGNLTIALNVGV
jgi:protocatechuate 3,4-dioxygenase beta subunit